MPADIGLVYDPATRRCDLAFAANDFAVDATAMTPLLVMMGCDRRAEPDDVLPSGLAEDDETRWNPRRGWVGDALDANGDRYGNRLWLLERAKQTEDVRQQAESYLAEAIASLEAVWANVSARAVWVRDGVLGLIAKAGNTSLQINRTVG